MSLPSEHCNSSLAVSAAKYSHPAGHGYHWLMKDITITQVVFGACSATPDPYERPAAPMRADHNFLRTSLGMNFLWSHSRSAVSLWFHKNIAKHFLLYGSTGRFLRSQPSRIPQPSRMDMSKTISKNMSCYITCYIPCYIPWFAI